MNWSFLIIDDDEFFIQTLDRALTRLGHQCCQAINAQQALSSAQQQKFDVVLVDLKLGEDNGLDLIKQLKDIQTEARILMLTGYASIATAVEATKRGAFQYLPKPVTTEHILNALDKTALIEQDTPTQPLSMDRIGWEHIQRVLLENDGNISASARELGMHRRTLQRKLQKRAPN